MLHHGPSSRLARVLVVVAVATAAFAVGGTPTARADDLEYEGHTRYDIDIAAKSVHVTADAVVTNNTPDEGNTYFTYPEFDVPVLAEATNLVARRDDGQPLSVRLEPEDVYAHAIVRLVPEIRYGQTIRFTLTYDLADRGPRASGYTRVTSGLASFLAFTFGSPGRGTLEVRAPADLRVESSGAKLTRTVENGTQVLTSGPLDDPYDTIVAVSARNDQQLVEKSFAVDGHDIVVQGWPDDPDWSTYAEQKLRAGIPVLQRLVGLDWPVEDKLTVAESSSPFVYGAAGWFLPYTDTIEVGDAFDDEVLMHEVSHLWFNDDLVATRWLGEGFAEVYGTAAAKELGFAAAPPAPVATDIRFPLDAWPDVAGNENLNTPDNADNEEFGYRQAFAVAQAVADAAGPDRMRALLASADAGELTDAGDGDADASTGTTDSPRLLRLPPDRG